MTDENYYRQRAAECLQAAQNAPPHLAKRLHEIAREWLHLAEQGDEDSSASSEDPNDQLGPAD